MCEIAVGASWHEEQTAVIGEFTKVVGAAAQGAAGVHTQGAVLEQAVPAMVPLVALDAVKTFP
jgi:uncharacterized membrane protein